MLFSSQDCSLEAHFYVHSQNQVKSISLDQLGWRNWMNTDWSQGDTLCLKYNDFSLTGLWIRLWKNLFALAVSQNMFSLYHIPGEVTYFLSIKSISILLKRYLFYNMQWRVAEELLARKTCVPGWNHYLYICQMYYLFILSIYFLPFVANHIQHQLYII